MFLTFRLCPEAENDVVVAAGQVYGKFIPLDLQHLLVSGTAD